jgi:hypothetical protein
MGNYPAFGFCRFSRKRQGEIAALRRGATTDFPALLRGTKTNSLIGIA